MDNLQNGNNLIASDDVSGGIGLPLQIQRVRLDQGTEGTSSPVNTSSPLFVRQTDAPSAITAGPITTASTQVFTTDTTGYESIGVQVFGTWAGGVIFQTSNDNSNWFNVQAVSFNGDTVQIDTAYGDDLLLFPATGRYFQAITSSTFVGSVSVIAYLRSQPVTLLPPTIGITADPATPLPIGGIGPDGVMRRIRTDVGGGITLADASQAIVSSGASVNTVLCVLDTTGYQSISLEIYGTWNGQVAFQCSNDLANWTTAFGNTPAGGAASYATANGLFVFPAYARWFRAYLLTYNSGNAQSIAYLRSTVVTPYNQGNVAVYGTTSPGTTPGNNPLLVCGVDNGTLARRLLTDTTGAMQTVGAVARDATPASTTNFVPVAGWDANQVRRLLTDVTGAVQVAAIQASTAASQSLLELQTQILLELKQVSFILRQLPVYLNSGVNPIDDDLIFRDDPTNLIN